MTDRDNANEQPQPLSTPEWQSLVERLRREQYAVDDDCSMPEYRRGWNAAMQAVIAMVSAKQSAVNVAGWLFEKPVARADETPVRVELDQIEEGKA